MKRLIFLLILLFPLASLAECPIRDTVVNANIDDGTEQNILLCKKENGYKLYLSQYGILITELELNKDSVTANKFNEEINVKYDVFEPPLDLTFKTIVLNNKKFNVMVTSGEERPLNENLFINPTIID